jgi:hypothetical protein
MSTQTLNEIGETPNETAALDSLSTVFADAFMRSDIQETQWYDVETSIGTECVPIEACGIVTDPRDLQDYCEGDINFDEDLTAAEQVPELKSGFIARLSAPGYMDCTDWSSHDTAEEAAQYLIDQYGDEA